jgi:hypothetical protein
MENTLCKEQAVTSADHQDWRDWLRLSLTPQIGLQTQHRLVTVFGSPATVFAQSAAVLLAHLSEAQAKALQVYPPDWDAVLARTQAWLAQSQPGVNQAIWTWNHDSYPTALRELDDPPLLLFVQGQTDRPCWQGVAVVGSRNPTPQGKENAKAFAAQLQQAGCCIVSGLAMGIDAAAHVGALQQPDPERCATVAVVGTGLDQVYPRQHHALAQLVGAGQKRSPDGVVEGARIEDQRGVVISLRFQPLHVARAKRHRKLFVEPGVDTHLLGAADFDPTGTEGGLRQKSRGTGQVDRCIDHGRAIGGADIGRGRLR